MRSLLSNGDELMRVASRNIILIIVVLGVPLMVGCRAKARLVTTPTPSADIVFSSGMGDVDRIKTRGTIAPAQTLQLSFQNGGLVRSLEVQVGTDVKEGDLIAKLDTMTLQFEFDRAQETVALRQAALDGLLNGPSKTLVDRAEVENAQQVAEAGIALRIAQLQLEQARDLQQAEQQAYASDIALARAHLEQASLQLAQARVQAPQVEVVAAEVGLARAQDAVNAARAEYQKAMDRPWEPQEVRDAHAKVIWMAQQDLRLAQARLNSAQDAQLAHALSLDILTAQRNAAANQLTQTLETHIAYTSTLSRQEAEVELAQLQLDALQSWQNPYLDSPSPAEVAQASALLRQAETAIAELEWRLQDTELRAPFDGVVAAVPLQVGEWAAPGEMVVELIDVSYWIIETQNVGELMIGQVQVGQEALVQVNAFPGKVLRGRVTTVSPVAVVQQGDTTYTLTIVLKSVDLHLRPGMTAQVEILTE
jgi:HlyD family secretion protein